MYLKNIKYNIDNRQSQRNRQNGQNGQKYSPNYRFVLYHFTQARNNRSKSDKINVRLRKCDNCVFDKKSLAEFFARQVQVYLSSCGICEIWKLIRQHSGTNFSAWLAFWQFFALIMGFVPLAVNNLLSSHQSF